MRLGVGSRSSGYVVQKWVQGGPAVEGFLITKTKPKKERKEKEKLVTE